MTHEDLSKILDTPHSSLSELGLSSYKLVLAMPDRDRVGFEVLRVDSASPTAPPLIFLAVGKFQVPIRIRRMGGPPIKGDDGVGPGQTAWCTRDDELVVAVAQVLARKKRIRAVEESSMSARFRSAMGEIARIAGDQSAPQAEALTGATDSSQVGWQPGFRAVLEEVVKESERVLREKGG